MNLKIISVLIIFLFFIPLAVAIDYPSSVGDVNDFANMLSPSDEARLNNQISALEKATTVEIAIVTIDSLQGVSIEEYAVKLFEKWGIGKSSNNNGLLILVSKNDREFRIETGYGLEGTINDARTESIGREIIESNFKKGEYGKGLYEAVVEIKGLVENDPGVVAKYERPVSRDASYDDFVIFTCIIFVFIGLILFYKYKNEDEKKAIQLQLISDLIAVVVSIYLMNFVATIFLMFLSLVFYRGIPREWIGESRSNDASFGGGWSGGGRSHDSSFGGGWSGGGGSHDGGFGGGRSGGGGYSGKW